MAPHSSTLAWKIPWTEEPGGLWSMGSLGVGHDWATSLSLFAFMHWRRKWQPTPVFLPGESRGRRSRVGCCLWVTQSRTRLKWLSSSSRPFLRRAWQPTPVFLPGKAHGQRTWWAATHRVNKESDTTEVTVQAHRPSLLKHEKELFKMK